MLRRSTKVQLLIFVLITLLGVSYVSAKYVGIFNGILAGNKCTIHADFPDSGGIFTNAEVTYRGVSVGKVGSLHLQGSGVRVDLDLSDCDHPKIPTSAHAAVSDRSVIGEQYVNLIPPDDKGPYFQGGEVITKGNTIPVSAQTLLTNMDRLVTSVDTDALQTTISELGKAFNDRGPDLGRLLDSSNDLLQTAEQNLPETIALIENSKTVLQTQLDLKQPLDSWTHSLNLLTAQLKASDPDIRRLLDSGPSSLDVVKSFVQDNRTDLGVTLANLAQVGTLLVRHLDGIEQVFELYPALAAGGETVVRSGGQNGNVGSLGFVVNVDDPPDCGDPSKGSEGYQGTVLRSPDDLSPQAPNLGAHCTAPASSGTNVRGSANVPGGDPMSTSGSGVAYPRAATKNTIDVGTQLDNADILGDKGWVAMLSDGLH